MFLSSHRTVYVVENDICNEIKIQFGYVYMQEFFFFLLQFGVMRFLEIWI